MAPVAGATGSPCSLVVGLDRSPTSEQALATAASVAAAFGAQLHLVHVVDRGDFPPPPGIPDWEDQARRRIAAEREVATAIVGAQVDHWTYRLLRGDPVTALIAVADEVDACMVVVGAPRQGWGDHLLQPAVRTTGHRLVASGRRPVLLVPGGPTTSPGRTVPASRFEVPAPDAQEQAAEVPAPDEDRWPAALGGQ